MFTNKRILITGGTGSFGNAFIKRFINSDIDKIIVFSRDEDKQDKMRNEYRSSKLKFILGNVREYGIVYDAMKGIDIVFHAAALKQVPSCDFAPLEAVKTNIFGTDNVLKAAILRDIEHVVCLSTGKAVLPINAMGLTKALMEKAIISRARELNEDKNSKTTLKFIRYSNVFATRGSAINIFTKQIKEGKPITLTHPQMKRSIMTVDEAVSLAIFAINNGENGDLFVYKARKTTLEFLAKSLQEIYKATNRDITIIGKRHGEKMQETILSQDELIRTVDMGEYVRVPMDKRGLNYFVCENEKSQRLNDLIKQDEIKKYKFEVPNLTLDDVKMMIRKNGIGNENIKNIDREDSIFNSLQPKEGIEIGLERI